MHLIDVAPMKQGWGRVWQTGVKELEDQKEIVHPFLVVSAIGTWPDIEAHRIGPLLSVSLDEQVRGCLKDRDLMAFTNAILAYLKTGVDVIIHCLEGKSRSTYLNCAVHMRGADMSYDDAFQLIKAHRPGALENYDFQMQLRRLELTLRAV